MTKSFPGVDSGSNGVGVLLEAIYSVKSHLLVHFDNQESKINGLELSMSLMHSKYDNINQIVGKIEEENKEINNTCDYLKGEIGYLVK